MRKRLMVVYLLLLSFSAVLFFRIYYLTAGDFLSAAATSQSGYRLNVVEERGMIYDRNFVPLVNTQERYIAAVMPCPESLSALSKELSGERREQMIESMSGNRPFLIRIDNPAVYAYGVDVFRTTQRYEEEQLAVHVVGHLSDGKGVLGIEGAYDEILSDCGSNASIRYTVDAKGVPLHATPPTVERQDSKSGVVLTIDRAIQQVVEQVAPLYIQKGAVVVSEAATGDIVALLSLPTFDPSDIPNSLKMEGDPFVNRALSQFSVGSTFKILVAATALESGIGTELAYECKGYTIVNGIRFGCHKESGHGWLTMQRAVEQSCNPYFVNLAQKIEPQKLLTLCEGVGLGRKALLAPGMLASGGTLPTAESLKNKAELANFSFGQGVFTASPLQVNSMMALVANGGFAVSPRLVKGATEDGAVVSEENVGALPVRLVSERTIETLRRLMVAVVEEGSGLSAKPAIGSAGGKTASAQTGQYKEAGGEIVHAWFAGFYPANEPKYVITVLNEDGNSGGAVAAPVFREVANGIQKIKG